MAHLTSKYNGWSDLSVKQFDHIHELYQAGDSMLKVIVYLEPSFANASITDLKRIYKQFEWLNYPPKERYHETYTIKGITYKFTDSVFKMPLAQFLDFMAVLDSKVPPNEMYKNLLLVLLNPIRADGEYGHSELTFKDIEDNVDIVAYNGWLKRFRRRGGVERVVTYLPLRIYLIYSKLSLYLKMTLLKRFLNSKRSKKERSLMVSKSNTGSTS